MPSDFPQTPRFLKGALVVFGAAVPVPTNVIVFQYNPDNMTRSLRSQTAAAAESPQRRTSGDTSPTRPPGESFTLSVELDAADQLENGNSLALATGLHAALAALELLLYPDSAVLVLNKALARVGMATITPAKVPLVLLVWGAPRVVPVRVTSVSVTEQAFDQLLNPIQAKVDLGLEALTQEELNQAGAPFDTLGIVNQVAKEVLARANVVSGVAEISASLRL